MYHSPLCGEERVHMMRAGRVCEGDIAEEMKRANKELVRTTTREGKAHMRQLSEMLEASDEVMRHKVMKGRSVSEYEIQGKGNVGLDADYEARGG